MAFFRHRTIIRHSVLKTANHSLIAYALSFMVCFFVLKTKISPLVFIGICGLAGVLGFVR